MDINSATVDSTAQDITDRIEEKLFAPEPENKEEDAASEDAEELSEDDDVDSDDEEGSEVDLDEIASNEDDEAEETLATYLGVDEDRIVEGEDGSIALKAIVDGESKLVPLQELAKSYQLQGHVNNKSMALETERKQFEEQRNQLSEQLKTRVDGIELLGKAFEKQLIGEYEEIDWNKLREEDPSEWSALRQEYAEKAQKLQRMQSLAQQENARIDQESQDEQKRNHEAYMQDQYKSMIAKNESWVDQEKMSADLSGIRTFLASEYGFDDDDMAAVSDHRIVSLIQDAKAYREGKKNAEVKKSKPVPKFQKSRAAKSNSEQLTKARKSKSLKAAVKKTGSERDVANFILDRM